jgi:hypothetical protein
MNLAADVVQNKQRISAAGVRRTTLLLLGRAPGLQARALQAIDSESASAAAQKLRFDDSLFRRGH